jgi:hypothetical protein
MMGVAIGEGISKSAITDADDPYVCCILKKLCYFRVDGVEMLHFMKKIMKSKSNLLFSSI